MDNFLLWLIYSSFCWQILRVSFRFGLFFISLSLVKQLCEMVNWIWSEICSNIWLSYILNRIFITSRVYLEPPSRPAPSWLVSSVGRALHRYRRGHGIKSRTGLNFFLGYVRQIFKPGWSTVIVNKYLTFSLSSCFLWRIIKLQTVSRPPVNPFNNS